MTRQHRPAGYPRWAGRALLLLPLLLAACAAPAPSAEAPVAPTPAVAAAVPSLAQTSAPPAATDLSAAAAAACTAPADLTPELTEGPYFKAGSPERRSLVEADTAGTKLVLSGQVLDTNCQPVPNALLDFWQADAAGQYDNAGFKLRGQQRADAAGRYQLETVIPGLYPGRTEHIHFKVQAPNGPVTTSQLFFPGVQDNESDSIFDPRLLLSLADGADGAKTATFNFVVRTD